MELADEQLEELADLALLGERMTKRQLRPHLVVVAPALALAHQVALVDQLGDDPVGGSLGDADGGRDVAQANAGVASDTDEHMGVIGEEVPPRRDSF